MAMDSGCSGLSIDPMGELFVTAPQAGRGRVLSLGQPVDPVVEQDDVHVDIAADAVHEMVAADAQTVAVARDDPHLQVGTRHLQARRDGRGPTVDPVDAVGLHVVRETAGTADPRDEDELLARHLQRGQHLLHLCQNGVVSATGTPAYVLVAGVIGRVSARVVRRSWYSADVMRVLF